MIDCASCGWSAPVACTLAALPIALLAWIAATALPRRPQVAHALWWLVLLKLATPPLFSVPLPLPVMDLPAWNPPAVNPPAKSAPMAGSTAPQSTHTRESRIETPKPVGDATGSAAQSIHSSDADSPMSRRAANDGWIAAAGRAAVRIASSGVLWPVSLAVSALLLGLAWRRGRNLSRWIRLAAIDDVDLTRRLRDLCDSAGLTAPRTVCVVESAIPPMLWGVGGSARVLIPRMLLERMSRESIDGVLLHEAAHFHRRDHVARFIEIVIGALLWWHPLAGLARRQIRCAEERCCDAMVVAAMPGQRRLYAATLMDCVSMLAAAPRPPVVVATAVSGFASPAHLKRRIATIACDRPRRALGGLGACGMTLLAVCVLALSASARGTARGTAPVPAGPDAADVSGLNHASPEPESIESILTRVPATVTDEALILDDAATFPAALRAARAMERQRGPQSSTTAAELGRTPALRREDLIGAWACREANEGIVPRMLQLTTQAYHVYVINEHGFELQQSVELNNNPKSLFVVRGVLDIQDDHRVKLTYLGQPIFRIALDIPEDEKMRIDALRLNASQDVLMSVEGERLTLVWEYADGSEQVQTFRRLPDADPVRP